jgi:hypothetical protein
VSKFCAVILYCEGVNTLPPAVFVLDFESARVEGGGRGGRLATGYLGLCCLASTCCIKCTKWISIILQGIEAPRASACLVYLLLAGVCGGVKSEIRP